MAAIAANDDDTILATGRSDLPNQVNNALCFPGFFRGCLDARAKRVTPEMKHAAAIALAERIGGIVVTLIPITCIAMTSLGLLLGTSFEPRNIGVMFGFIILPLTFLGGVYYQWTRLAPVRVGSVHWLQILVLVNPLIYITEGMRAGLTHASHMHLYIVYPVVIAFGAVFLALGLKNFRRRVLS